MATAIIRDSQFGQIARLLTNRQILKYPEETSDETCKNYLLGKDLDEEHGDQDQDQGDGEKGSEPNPNLVKWAGADDPENPEAPDTSCVYPG
ncbi:uncharacterized protein BDV17DRAFT_293435 [Aspergillus undulatus]|uniref:uncharacterized protein n=1 Tax=Aspergillus undulatus TaxID=1810928 RepID=UPI003CCCE87C